MSIGYLYVTTNNENGTVYVGQSSKLDAQNIRTYLGSGDYFRDAVAEFGADQFSKEIVAYYEDQADLDYAELLLIAKLRAAGYSLYNGGVGGPRSQFAFLGQMFQEFGVHPKFPRDWLQAIEAHPETVKNLLASGNQVSREDFYGDLEQQLRQSQDLSRDCPRCGVLVGEVCRTKSGNPSRNHAGRRH